MEESRGRLQFSGAFVAAVATATAAGVATAAGRRLGGGVFFRDVAFEGDGVDDVLQHRAGIKNDVGTVEEGGAEVFDCGRTFAAGNHPEGAELAQVDGLAVGKGFVHDFDQPVEDQDDLSAAGGTEVFDTGADLVQRQLFRDAGLCMIKGRAFGCAFAHVFALDESVN